MVLRGLTSPFEVVITLFKSKADGFGTLVTAACHSVTCTMLSSLVSLGSAGKCHEQVGEHDRFRRAVSTADLAARGRYLLMKVSAPITINIIINIFISIVIIVFIITILL